MPFKTYSEKQIVKNVTMAISIIAFLESIRLWIKLDNSSAEFQYLLKFDWMDGVLFGADGISIVYIVLTTLLIPICLLTVGLLEIVDWIYLIVLL